MLSTFASFSRRAAVLGGALLIALSSVHLDAFAAKRMGGGKSSGKQSSTAQKETAAPAQNASTNQSVNQAVKTPAPAAAPAAAAAPKRSWMGPLAGLAAGLGIAALLSHFGLGAGLAEFLGNFLMIALFAIAALMVWRWFRARGAAKMQPAYAGGYANQGNQGSNQQQPSYFDAQPQQPAQPSHGSTGGSIIGSGLGGAAATAATVATTAAAVLPAGFDAAGFERNAKVYFLRLQAAWDSNNVADIREFSSPEMYAELKMQLDERNGSSHTDVRDLHARVVAVENEGAQQIASVHFTGQIAEDGAAAESFSEVWNLSKPLSGNSGWVLAGIQQV